MAEAFSITYEGEGAQHVAILRNGENRTEARVAVGYGFNVFSFKVPCNEELTEQADVLYAEPGFPRADLRATANGTPILVPFPNRIAGGRFSYGGKDFKLPCNDHGVNAIHGFAFDRPWRIVKEETEPWLEFVGEFELFRDLPSMKEHWPGNFRVRCQLNLLGCQLDQRFTVTNLSDAPIPFGLGTHPYFRLVGDGSGSLNECGIIVDASTIVELDHTIPTGNTTPADDETRLMMTSPHINGRIPVPIGERKLDDVYTGLRKVEKSKGHPRPFEHFVFDQQKSVTVMTTISHSVDFQYVVVYVPPHRKAICIEPYTCVTNAMNLDDTLGPGGPPTGLWHLAPGEERTVLITMAAQAFDRPKDPA